MRIFICTKGNCFLQKVICTKVWLRSRSVAEFKEFERRFKFKPRFKCGWFHLKLYQKFQDLSQTGFWRILADLNRGSNSLNSISGLIFPTFKNKKIDINYKHGFCFLFWNHNDFNRTVWISFCFKRCPYIATIWCI